MATARSPRGLHSASRLTAVERWRSTLTFHLLTCARPGSSCDRGDITAGPVDRGAFDLVTARAVLHHVADAEAAIVNLVTSLRPGGALLLIEPDFLPVSVAEPPEVRTFWDGWLAWSRERGIDYQIGRTLAPRLAALGSLEHIAGTAETAIYNGDLGPTTGRRRSWSFAAIS